MITYALHSLVIMAAMQLGDRAAEQPSYRGQVRMLIPVYTPDGQQLPAGSYDVHVRPSDSSFVLELMSSGQVKATLQPIAKGEEATVGKNAVLVAATQYLRSSAQPVLTTEERHFSKTGRAQYEEEARDWKAALRSYKNREDGSIFLVFEERQKDGRWRRFSFRMASSPSGAK